MLKLDNFISTVLIFLFKAVENSVLLMTVMAVKIKQCVLLSYFQSGVLKAMDH